MSTCRNDCQNNCKRPCGHCSPCRGCPVCFPLCCCPAGPTGSPGPTGPAGETVFLSGFQAQLSNAADTLLEDNHNVLFNLVTDQPGSDITYNNATGEFILHANKNYYVSWWVAVNGTKSAPIIEIATAINNSPVAIASSPQVTCQLSGATLIPAGVVPQALSIMNVSKDSVRYAVTSIQASIVITELAV